MKARSLLTDPPPEQKDSNATHPEYIVLKRGEYGFGCAIVVTHPRGMKKYGWTHWIEFPELD